MKILSAIFCTAMLAAFSLASPVSATSVLRMLDRSGLVQEDINIMAQEASKLYLGGRAAPGAETEWSNPATGAHGTARITEVDGACVDILYTYRSRARPAPQSITLRRCRSGNQWILSN